MNFLGNLSKLSTFPSHLLELYGMGLGCKQLSPILVESIINNFSFVFLFVGGVRFAAKKSQAGAKWQGNGKRKKKYRGLKKKDGEMVTAGTMLATQITLRFFPGLNVCNSW